MTAVVRALPGLAEAADSRLPLVDVHVDEASYTVTLDVSHLVDIGGLARVLQEAKKKDPDIAEAWRILTYNRSSVELQLKAANKIRAALGFADCFKFTMQPSPAYHLSKQIDEASEEPEQCGDRYCANYAELDRSLCAMHLGED